ncbi:bifunctional DNA primase/polymerase [Streptomyces sp. NPDC048717]|uniref:bifunctional DNA primase/polymerase n=1 Tax=Streptomyces sp. NPDC048717 TaxID=3154928 RepID=UPI0034448D4E
MSAVPDARRLVRRGLSVFPLPPGGRVPEPGWQQLSTQDEAALPGLLAAGHNVGIGCRASRVVALDLDAHDEGPTRSGIETLLIRMETLGLVDWPRTLTVMTPSTGLHLYFRVSRDCTIGGRTALGPGIDVRGPGRRSGGYLVGPGSIVGGLPYTLVSDVPVAPLPRWIEGLLSLAA